MGGSEIPTPEVAGLRGGETALLKPTRGRPKIVILDTLLFTTIFFGIPAADPPYIVRQFKAPEGSARRRLHGEALCHEPTPHRLGEEGGQKLPILVQAPAGGGPRNRSHPAFRPRPLPAVNPPGVHSPLGIENKKKFPR